MPEPGLVDPRLLALDPSAFFRGAGQGLQLAGLYGQNRDASVARQEAAALAAPRLAAQRAQLELAPEITRNQLAVANVNRLRAENTPIVLDESFGVAEVPRLAPDGTAYAAPDVMLQSTAIEIDPVTGERKTAVRGVRPLSTIEQQAQQEAAIAAREEANRIRETAIAAQAANQEALARSREEQQAERERRNQELERVSNENLKLRTESEKRLKEQGDERIKATNEAREAPLRQLSAMEKTRVADGRTLAQYIEDTRDPATGQILVEDGGWFGDDRPVRLDQEAEKMVTRYRQVAAEAFRDELAPAPAPTAAAPVAPGAAAVQPTPSAAPSATPTGGTPPTLTPQQAQSLPSGSTFYGTDGVLRRKP
jgi:hypothetical protein